MKKQVIVRPVTAGRKIWLDGTIIKKNGERDIITEDYRIFREAMLPPGTKRFVFKFDNIKTGWLIEYDDTPHPDISKAEKGELADEYDTRKKVLVHALCGHHQMKPLYGISNPNLKASPLFELEDLSVKNRYQSGMIINQHLVVNKVLEMSYVEKLNCAYYYGFSGVKKDHSDVFIFLADFKTGALHSDVKPNPETPSVMEDFLENYNPGVMSVDIRIVVEKACAMGLFQRKENGYYYMQQYVGGKKENLYDYCKSNLDTFEFIKEQVDRASVGFDDIASIFLAFNAGKKEEEVKKPKGQQPTPLATTVIPPAVVNTTPPDPTPANVVSTDTDTNGVVATPKMIPLTGELGDANMIEKNWSLEQWKVEAKKWHVNAYWAMKDIDKLKEGIDQAKPIIEEATAMGLPMKPNENVDNIAYRIKMEKRKLEAKQVKASEVLG